MDDFPVWKGLFEWSMKYQDGSVPTAKDAKPQTITPERRAWLESALGSYMQDFAQRMKQIKEALEKPDEQQQQQQQKKKKKGEAAAAAGGEEATASASARLQEREALLDELMDIVCSLDQARDLHKIGGLPPLLGLLRCRHPSLRWRAAEVIATCVANNPPVQQWFMDGGVMPPLMALMGDADATCRTKALLALSALVRHFAPGLAAFREAGGVSKVVDMCSDGDSKVQRKALSLLQYLLVRDRSGPTGADACSRGVLLPLSRLLGAVHPSTGAAPLGPSGSTAGEGGEEEAGSELRQAALSVLLELARGQATWGLVSQVTALPAALARLRAHHAALSPEDREAEMEEDAMLGEMQALLAQGPPHASAAAGDQEESDHVPIDPSETNVSLPLKKPVAGGQQGSDGGGGGFTLPPGGGGMVALPRIDPF